VKLLRVKVVSAATCGGLLDGFELWFRSADVEAPSFTPLCLVGPNGSGKSQLMQILAEMFQSLIHECNRNEERAETNPNLQFELEYLIRPKPGNEVVHIRVSRIAHGKQRPKLIIQRRVDLEWIDCDLHAPATQQLLPRKVVGYTSGDNETLSLPFLASRGGYAEDVSQMALEETKDSSPVTDTRLMLIDYGTHLEVLVANLLLGNVPQRNALLKDALVKDLHSFRCIVQLSHSAAPRVSRTKASASGRKGVQLTAELEKYIDQLRRCSTCHDYDKETETYTFDYYLDEQTRNAFAFFWDSAFGLYSSFHKLSMLNDLAIPKIARERSRKDAEARRFAARLPEPQDEDKIFRFQRVTFRAQSGNQEVDYVSISDGEHQLIQVLGIFCMLSFPNVIFLLDEPESHFNPVWRVKFLSLIRDLPTANGDRSGATPAAEQDCIMTTHAPFVPSDMSRDRVFIFKKENGKVIAQHPDIETYGTNFDAVLEECFGVHPPISDLPKEDIARLMKSRSPKEIEEGIKRLGNSVDKVFLADRLRQLQKKDG
jgi:restriction system-associated AAA family ATPase